jgi:hypothetical protein
MADIGSSYWSPTDASNNSAAPNGAPEGMSPGGVNDVLRAHQGAIRRWYEWSVPKTTGGTTSAYTLTYTVAPGALVDGMTHIVQFDAANAAAATLNVNSLGAKTLQYYVAGSWRTLPASVVSANRIVAVTYNLAADTYRMATLPAIVFPPGYIQGLTYANNGSDPTNDIDIAAGSAIDATGAYPMTLASSITKRLDAAWAVGTNQGGIDTGSASNTDYYIWLIARPDTGVVDVLFSTSSTSPTMPTDYSYKRLIGWFKRSGGAIVTFQTFEDAGGGLEYIWKTKRTDLNLASTLTTTRRSDALSVPLNFSTLAKVVGAIQHSVAGAYVHLMNPDDTDEGGGAQFVAQVNGVIQSGQAEIRTNSSGEVASKGSTTLDAWTILCEGFRWGRRP